MVKLKFVLFSMGILVQWSLTAGGKSRSFPPGFRFGAATSAYKIEGAWNVSDKSVNIWDHFTHSNSSAILDGSNGDFACNSYYNWRRDVEMAVELNLKMYRFSVSWSRLLPSGFTNFISSNGSNYYNNLIDALLESGIEPVITLYHWDLPQRLQNLGGWTNPLVADWFGDYSRVVYSLYGDRVKTWLTIDEPVVMCNLAYNTGGVAPGIYDPHIGTYVCVKHVLLAHATAWRIYDEEFKSRWGGKVSIVNVLAWYVPSTDEDEVLTELVRQYGASITHAIYSPIGNWPPIIQEKVSQYNRRDGYPKNRFATLTQEQVHFIQGTYDFFALNHCTSNVVRRLLSGEQSKPFPLGGVPELDAVFETSPNWSQNENLQINPRGIRDFLNWLRSEYGDVEFMITENGYPFRGSNLDDNLRITYYTEYLEQVLLAIEKDKINVTGFIAWSMMDTFEWIYGYTIRYGLYQVDFESPMRTRTPRSTARFYSAVAAYNSLDVFDEFGHVIE